MFFYRHRRQRNYGVYLLAYQLFNSRSIPPVTLAAILFQVVIFLGYIPALGQHKTEAMCLLPSRILHRLEWIRLLASVFMHADDMHLYFNMVSLLWKGRRLEPLLGSGRFLLLLITFAVTTSCTMVGLSYLADEIFHIGGMSFMSQCAVGFSGVLFALKVLHTTYFPYSDYNLFGWLPIPSKYACWVELLLLQMVTPNASFIGHLSGILVGLAYTMGPLKTLVDIIEASLPFQIRVEPRRSAQTRNWTRTPNSSSSGTYDEYTGGMSEEEQMWRAMQRSLYENRSNVPLYPDY